MDLSQRNQLEQSKGRQIFKTFLAENGFGADTLDKFDTLTELYLRVCKVINISALHSLDDVYIKHYLDSVYPYKLFAGECCDVGCGGGFPCLPLAITTGLNFTGIDGVGKKLILIDRCRAELGINNITAEHVRAEELFKLHREFDTVCARAVADTDKVLGYCAPLVKKSGSLILFKTQNDNPASAKIADKLKVTLSQTIDYNLPQTDIKRRLFIYLKT